MAEQRTRWPALETNPAAMNKYLRELSVPEPTQLVDVYAFDGPLLDALPATVHAVLLTFPCSDKVRDGLGAAYEQMKGRSAADALPQWAFFMEQHIGNACGTFALIHALANRRDKLDLGAGALCNFLRRAGALSPAERSAELERDAAIGAAHARGAAGGETPQDDDNVRHHFVALLARDDKLWEFDGRAPCPRDRGECSESGGRQSLMAAVAAVVADYVQMEPANAAGFNAMALCDAPANF